MPPASEPATSEFATFITLWTGAYHDQFGRPYAFHRMGQEGKALKDLLETGIKAQDLIEVARRAWTHTGGFWTRQAVTISGLCYRYNEITAELPGASQRERSGHAGW